MNTRSAFMVLAAIALAAALCTLFFSIKPASSAPLAPATAISWVGPNQGYWNVPGNWSTNSIPGAADDVTIGSGNTVTYTTGTSTINSLNSAGTLFFTGGSLTVSSASSLNSLQIIGANVFFNGDTTVSNLSLSGSSTTDAELGGSGTMTISTYFHWHGCYPYSPVRKNSRISGPGKTILASTAEGISGNYYPTCGEITLGGSTPGSGRTLENYGRYIQGGCLRLQNGSILENKSGARIERGGTCYIGNSGGSLVNAGTMEIYSTGSIEVPTTNSGLIDVLTPGVFGIRSLSNSGTIRGMTDCWIELGSNSGGPYTLSTNSVITATQGTVSFVGDQAWTIQGTYRVKTTRLDDYNSATITINPGTTVQLQDVLIHGGKLVLQPNTTLNNLTIKKGIVGWVGSLAGDGNVTVNGLLRWQAGSMVGPGSTTVNGSLLIDTPEVKQLGETDRPRSLYINGTGTWSDGNIDALGISPLIVQAGHSLTARGVFTGTLTNNGTLHVGGSPGTLTTTGAYNQATTGVLNMELGGANPGEFDRLNVGTLATLAGTLNVSEINGFSLAGNSLNILTYSSRSGTFSTHNLPPNSQYSYQANALNVSGAGQAPLSASIDGPSSGVIFQPYAFSASFLPANATPPLSYTWDPAPDSGQGTNQAAYSWSVTGGKTITVTVSNSFGSAQNTQNISILDVPIPGLAANNSGPHILGETTVLTATINSGTNVGYAWDFGDGSPGASSASALHDYASEGTYTAVVTATNTSGNAITSTQVTIWGTMSPSGGTLHPAEDISVEFPSGALTDTIVLQFELLPGMTAPGFADVGIFYNLDPVYLSSGAPAQLQPGSTYTITVSYQEQDIPTGVAEADLALFYWDGSGWVREPTSVVDTLANTITATPGHFSLWGALVGWENKIYLPFLTR